jgi:hypothetical protein
LIAAASDRDDARQAITKLTAVLSEIHSELGGALETLRFSAEMHYARGDVVHGSRSRTAVETIEKLNYRLAKIAIGNGGIDRLIIELADPERPL